MAAEMVVETIHKETIKPSSPTPPRLKIFKLSLLDQLAPALRVPLIFWYPNYDTDDFAKAKQRSRLLKESLSETLSRFYPFAGRILSSSTIDCNDEGVCYIEARVNCLLKDIFKQPDGKLLRKLIPTPQESGEEATGPIVLVKVVFFQCGGMAICISVSHKTADVSTGSLFINNFAAKARGNSTKMVISEPVISLSSFLPPMELPSVVYKADFDAEKFPTRRLVFDALKISMLKAEAASPEVPQPSRVQAVTALIWECAMEAATSNRGGTLRQLSALNLPVSFRKKVNPSVPENAIGNIINPCVVQTSDSKVELQGLVQQLRNGIREFNEKTVTKLQGSSAISTILECVKACGALSKRENVDFYNCTSWCRSELYEADFGWGKPKWVSTGGYTMPNVFTLMDSSDGQGIEAWVSLSKEEMVYFERNEELLRFASVNPSVVH